MFWHTIRQHIRLSLMSASTTFIPWMLPLTYAAIGGLQINGTDPLLISILAVLGAIIGTTLLWILDYYASDWIKAHIKIPKKWLQDDHLPDQEQFKKGRIARWTQRLHDKLHVIHRKPILFRLVALTTYSAIPDILIIRYTRKKLPFPLFILATIIGKIIVYVPIIYGIELISGML